jgi:hypothetical protein
MNVNFTKKEISEILKDEFSEQLNLLSAKKEKSFFRSGAEYKNTKQLVQYFSEHEGNYFTLSCEMKDEFKSLLS